MDALDTLFDKCATDLKFQFISNAMTPGSVFDAERRHLAEKVFHLFLDKRRSVQVDAAARVHPALHDRHYGTVPDRSRHLRAAWSCRQDEGQVWTVRRGGGVVRALEGRHR